MCPQFTMSPCFTPCTHQSPVHPVPAPGLGQHTLGSRGGEVVREKVWWIHCRPVTITSPAIIGSIKLRLITAWYRDTNQGIEDVPPYHLTIPSHLSLDTASAWPLLLALLFRHFKRMDITYSDLFGYICKQKYICWKTLDVKCLKGFIEWFLCLQKCVQSHPLNGEDEDTSSSLWWRG